MRYCELIQCRLEKPSLPKNICGSYHIIIIQKINFPQLIYMEVNRLHYATGIYYSRIIAKVTAKIMKNRIL